MFKRILVQYGVEKNTIKVFLFLLYCVFSSLLSLFIYMAVFYPTEFLLTEKLIVAERVSLIISSSFLLSIIAVIALTDWKKSVTPFFAGGLIFVLAGINFFGNKYYFQVKSRYELNPKIFQIEPKEGLRGQFVTVNGNNFVYEGKIGKVLLGKNEADILIWEEDKIMFEQPFLPRYGIEKLYIVRSDGAESNRVNYYVKNPGE